MVPYGRGFIAPMGMLGNLKMEDLTNAGEFNSDIYIYIYIYTHIYIYIHTHIYIYCISIYLSILF